MPDRRIVTAVERALSLEPAVALLGPRQVGKTTLARTLAAPAEGPAPDYLDLENPADLAKLEDAGAFLRSRSDRLVVIDEVQRAPGLFDALRGVIDDRTLAGRPNGHFLLLGPASLGLLSQSGESLAGRIACLELAPLDVLEVGTEVEVERRRRNDLWIRGGFPPSLLAVDDAASADWRANFITTYLERDIPRFRPRIPAITMRRFWTMLAHRQGAPFDAAELAKSLDVGTKTVSTYLDLMVDLLLVRRLPPLQANVGKRLAKAPKTYLRDSGLVHSLLRLGSFGDVLGHPVARASWEGHVVSNLSCAAPPGTSASYYRTVTGDGIDLVLDLPDGRRWAIDAQLGTAPAVAKGFRAALDDVKVDAAFVVYSGEERYPKGEGIEAIGLAGLTRVLAALR